MKSGVDSKHFARFVRIIHLVHAGPGDILGGGGIIPVLISALDYKWSLYWRPSMVLLKRVVILLVLKLGQGAPCLAILSRAVFGPKVSDSTVRGSCLK